MTMQSSSDIIEGKMNLLVQSFRTVLYEDDEIFLKNMTKKQLASDDIGKYRHWEWTQGVGLYGFWKLYEKSGNKEYLDVLTDFFDGQLANGLPSKNVNTVAPLLPLSYLYERTGNKTYLAVCSEWAEWVLSALPRTEEGGFQHITSDSLNEQELWDDTLFMTVLFLANMGRILGREEYIKEATYQFLLHVKYLADPKSGLWYHGWTFRGKHNFAGAFWGRGNCWITIAIPTFIDMVKPDAPVEKYLRGVLLNQVSALRKCQDGNGMWHTLLDDPTSYVEASATSGFAYGILYAVRRGLLDASFRECANRALQPILDCIDAAGIVNQVSYGTAMGRETKDFYKAIPIKSMPYGQAIAILFLMEALADANESGGK